MQSTTTIIHNLIAVKQSQDIFHFNIKRKNIENPVWQVYYTRKVRDQQLIFLLLEG